MAQILGDRYEVQQQLAKKSGRRTLLARDLITQNLVVLKLLSFSSDFEWDDLKLFQREAEILKTLSHPAIPRYLDYFELDSAQFKGFALVQTYLPAKSLETHLKKGVVFSEFDVKQIAIALLEILTYLHSHQPPVIHRDIKPSNILLTRLDNCVDVYLVDFGSVQTLAAREGGTMTVVGTYGYMPPEQFGDRAVPASDLYSLGATLMALVTGTHPADLPHRDGRIQFEQVTTLSPVFIRWLRRMTEPSLDRRFLSAKQALQALDRPIPDDAVTVVKPFDSKVLLHKDANVLEITLPAKGFSPEIVGLTLFAIAWNSFIVVWTGFAVAAPFPINLFFTLFSLLFWGAGAGMVWQIVSNLFRRVRLRIDQKQISLSHEVLGWRYRRPRVASIQNITKLERTSKFMSMIKNSEGDRVEIKPRINIWVGIQKYELGAHSLLTEPEIDWLAQELSDWLGMPVVKE
ncbi:serine/threonine protein kinase [Gloeocapsopsis dulcis]|uniref:Serine/threonine protein kinase n=1 Tax=Gloeocapsopsis dulcis AAB1 = 1H9 TaxID=1433147 RepID=A0A6N8FRT4_9CHRO|nr:serine/threonine-protein kinase [Gloeocapsopsis dulcis]MUL35589.1 serine/threonine protein kinase [Gloeocapsopsis dulcis AAB1 = 1H9]WNN87507.1 serine/threonine-protein kinase [Gloeocapsopsis dulcis]